MAQIFLSYRRSDSQYATRSISDRLQKSLGKEALFQDVKSVSLGEDFEKRVNDILANCDVMLVIMGDEWLTVEEEDGSGRRLDNPGDLVRREVAEALVNDDTIVIPVLTGDAEMPKPDELPDDLIALSTRNAAVVRADASFESQMDALIEEIQRKVPELRPVIRYGKFGLIGVAAVAVVGIALAIYFNFRAPDDLSGITWSGKQNPVRDMEFGEIEFQGIYLRTGEDAPTISGGELKKYKLKIDVEDQVEHEHEATAVADFDHASEHGNLLTATQAYWVDLPEGHGARGKEGAFLKFEAGKRYGTAMVTISYVNKDDRVITSTEKEVHILAPRSIERETIEKLDEVVASVTDATLNDQEILDQANTMLNGEEAVFTLENGSGLTYNDVLSPDQREILADRVAKAQDAVAKFEYAESLKNNMASLAERRQPWRDYILAASALGRSESPQYAVANGELHDILSFSEEQMDVSDASACSDIVSSDCVGPKSCFGANESVKSWARLLVRPANATIVHRLVNANNGEVVASESTNVLQNNSQGYRSSKSLRADGATGEFRAQVTYRDVVVSSVDVSTLR